jgi:hypothetical protein
MLIGIAAGPPVPGHRSKAEVMGTGKGEIKLES